METDPYQKDSEGSEIILTNTSILQNSVNHKKSHHKWPSDGENSVYGSTPQKVCQIQCPFYF
jgi:hypothetical protein